MSAIRFVSLWSLILIIGGAGTAMAANDSRVPMLLVPGQKKPKEKEPLRMSGLEIDVEVLGHMATTTLTMTFRNDLDRILEGELVFPLGDGESVSRFAMSMADIENMREGVVIEKARGRQIFESTVRKQVDPGLLEMTKGNNFRSRVYPIPAKGEKRIIVGYEGTLQDVGDHVVYTLPLEFTKPIDGFRADVRVAGAGGDPDFSGGMLKNSVGSVAELIHHTGMEREDFIPDEALSFKIPKGDKTKARSFVHVEEGRKGKTTHFHTTVPLVGATGRAKPKPATLCLLWDASGSASKRDTKVELATLEAYFKTLGEAKVSLVVFRDRPEKAESFSVAGGDWSKLRERLAAIAPDGGTGFGALDLGGLDCDEFILVSDGLATFGEDKLKLGGKPVLALNSSSVADHSYLRSVARSSGGQYVNLNGIEAEAAAEQMSGQRLRFLRVEGGGDRLSEVYPQPGAAVDGGSFSLAGILQGDARELILKFGYGDKVTQQQIVTIGAGEAAQSPRAKRLWAERKIAELSLDYEGNEEAIIAVAKEYGIVTRGTSLIVLDTLDDYLEHRVIPPKEMQKEYFERLEAADLAEEKPLREHLEGVASGFDERKKWYGKQFPGLEAALLTSAQFEVERAKALVKSAGIRVFKRSKLAKEALAPAQEMLEQAKALAEESKKIDKDPEALAGWKTKAEALSTKLVAFSQGIDKSYPEMDRAEIESDGGDDPFGGGGSGFGRGGRMFFGGMAASEAPGEALADTADDPFASGGDEGRALLRRRPARAPAAPESSAFPVTPATPADADAEYDPPEIPSAFASRAGGFHAVDDAFGADPSAGEAGNPEGGGGIALKKWNPDTPYLKEMKRAKDADDAYRVYLKARRNNLDSSAFYLDVADHFIELKRKDLALRVLSNIAEMNLESAPLLRILGHRLLQIGEAELAAVVFEEVLEIREEEPQSYRDLALAKMALGENKRAAELLWQVVGRPWDDRFEGVDQIALAELNRLIAREGDKVKPGGMDDALGYAMPVDLRVILTWDADNTDIDLWVIDPSGEVCKYDHNRTVTGGRMSNDFTEGYGPEEFVIKDALPGEYIIKANYYGNSQQTLAGATTIQAEIFTDYGRSSEKSKSITLRLRDEEDVVEVGRVSLGG